MSLLRNLPISATPLCILTATLQQRGPALCSKSQQLISLTSRSWEVLSPAAPRHTYQPAQRKRLIPMAADANVSAATIEKPDWLTMPVILGSKSSSRKAIMDELTAELGISYTTAAADIDEKSIRHEEPHELVQILAAAKAQAIIERWQADGQLPTEGLLITTDQVVVCDDRILEKPADETEARQFITGYSNNSAFTVGSVRVTNLATAAAVAGTDSCEVEFGEIPEGLADKLIAEGSVFHCAGGLMVEHPDVSPLITGLHGDLDSIMGLPASLLMELLRKAALSSRMAKVP